MFLLNTYTLRKKKLKMLVVRSYLEKINLLKFDLIYYASTKKKNT